MSEHAQAQPVSGSPAQPAASGFFQEISDHWQGLPHKFLFGILFAAWCALYYYYGNATLGYTKSPSLFAWAYSVYTQRDDDAFGQYIPYVVLLFLWFKRGELASVQSQIWKPALIYFAAALLLHFMAFRIQQTRVSVLAFILGLHALIGALWGPTAMRRTIFPIFLLLFCIPFGSIADIITLDLRIFVTKVAVGIGHDLLGIQVFRDGSQIFGEHGRPLYDVAPACSGMRSLTAMGALSMIYAFLNLNGVVRRAILIASALPLAILANIVRITTVIIVGDIWGDEYGAMIEQKFGFVTFAIAIGGMMTIGWLIRERKPQPPAPLVEVLEAKPV